MADHRVTSVELAQEHFPNNELATEITVREAIDVEEGGGRVLH
jgi:hypothetical protein